MRTAHYTMLSQDATMSKNKTINNSDATMYHIEC